MKTLIKIFAVCIVFNIGNAIFPAALSAQQVQVSYQVFYDELSPYGRWVDYPEYGYVWIPDNDADFYPYSTHGYWVYTDFGWTWVSDYKWGWAPFHYGRWHNDVNYGWFWVPGNEWGPAWVHWRRCDGYYGWAPMEPGISISIGFSNSYSVPNDRWVFVRTRYFGNRDMGSHYIGRTRNREVIRNSVVIQNTREDNTRHRTYITGPDKDDVRKSTGRTITPVAVKENTRPGELVKNDRLQLYMPDIQKNETSDHKPKPGTLTNLNDVKPHSRIDKQKRDETKIAPDEKNNVNTPRINEEKNNMHVRTERKDEKKNIPQPPHRNDVDRQKMNDLPVEHNGQNNQIQHEVDRKKDVQQNSMKGKRQGQKNKISRPPNNGKQKRDENKSKNE